MQKPLRSDLLFILIVNQSAFLKYSLLLCEQDCIEMPYRDTFQQLYRDMQYCVACDAKKETFQQLKI